MRLDHLLSKEKIIVKFVLSLGWALVSVWLVASFSSLRVGFACGGKFFQVGNASYVVLCACGVVGVDEAKAFAVFQPSWL